MSIGVPGGATIADIDVITNWSNPLSTMVGRSGASGLRAALVTANPRSWPSRIYGSIWVRVENRTWISPASRPVRA
jgi:hypothetical protein